MATPEDNQGDLATLTKEFAEATREVKELGRQIVSDTETGRKSHEELVKKVDAAMQKQGEINQQILELQQAVAKGLDGYARGDHESLGEAIQKHLDENPDVKAMLANATSHANRGKSVNIPLSRKALLGSTDSGQALNYPGQQLPMVAPLVRRLTIRDLLMPGRTEKPIVFYPRETGFTGGPTVVAEGAGKPEFNITIENVTQEVPTIAHWTDVSLQMLDDVPYIQSYIEGRMLYQLALVRENQYLNGSAPAATWRGSTRPLLHTHSPLVSR